jgi:phosphopantothenoylcysteine decarboxylase / phosphopantothenate---cysteine ligase
MRRKLNILVTAGPTVEDIDPVRFISNRASGRLGFEITRAALQQRHRVILVHGPVAAEVLSIVGRPTHGRLDRKPVRSAADMLGAVLSALPSTDAVIMNAAVADFTPAKLSAIKLKKKGSGLTLRLKPTVDILATLGCLKRTRKRELTLIGFALETGRGRTPATRARSRIQEALRKLAAKNLDAIVLDTPAEIGAREGVFQIVARTAESARFQGTKRAFAARLIALVESRVR